MLWIALHLPSLSLESFAATQPKGGAAALALLAQHRIAQADAAAQALGVRAGLSRATALALAPDLVLGQADARRDAQALHAVANVAQAFTPSVCIDGGEGHDAVSGDPAHTVLLEVEPSLRYFGGLARLLAALHAALALLGHVVRSATAPTAQGAALLARWRDDLCTGPHSQDLAALRELLDGAPVHLLGPGREHWDALQGMGLRTLSDLRQLPRSGLTRRFGAALLADLDRARGDAPDPRRWLGVAPTFDQRIELFARADHSEQLCHGANVLLARLVAWAQARKSRVARFTLVMHHEVRHRVDDQTPASSSLEIALARPSADLAHLQMLLVERLGRLELPAPTLELSLRCDALAASAAPNSELFPTRAAEREGLGRLIERLQARLGRDGVQRIELVDDHRPEFAVRMKPADAAMGSLASGAAVASETVVPVAAQSLLAPTGQDLAAVKRRSARRSRGGNEASATTAVGAAGGKESTSPTAAARRRAAPVVVMAQTTLPLTRPIWLLAQPLPLPERDSRPLLAGRPLQLLAGPERIESGWWDGALAARDYFIASDEDGALVWIWRERLPLTDAGEGWFLQGRFG
jgi:protein ImuB